MAYDKDKRKLYTTTDSSGKKIGIPLWEIYDCLRYNKVDQRGNRNLGMVIKNGNINLDSLFRPYKTSKPTLGEGVFKSGGEDGLYGYIIPMTENNNVADLWRKTWSHKERPDKYFKQDMFDGYWHLASFVQYPFGIRKSEAGDNYSIEYFSNKVNDGSVCPDNMEIFKTYYPAFQIFEEEYSGQPKSTPMYNWCGERPLGQGVSGMQPIDLGFEEGKSYFLIPFLSQYKFTSQAGDMGTLTGKKYCLIYKDFKVSDWTLGYLAPENMYSLVFDSFSLAGAYGAQVAFTVSSERKNWQAVPYGGYRIFTKVNGVETVWKENWNSYDFKYNALNADDTYIQIDAGTSHQRSIQLSWGGESLPSSANRIQVRIFDPTHSSYEWIQEFEL
jgi:hypothetical protein